MWKTSKFLFSPTTHCLNVNVKLVSCHQVFVSHNAPFQDLSPPDHPALSEMGSIADLSSRFRSLTARKLLTGGSVTSIDTLIEVNSAALRDSVMSSGETNMGSGDTVDFGVI